MCYFSPSLKNMWLLCVAMATVHWCVSRNCGQVEIKTPRHGLQFKTKFSLFALVVEKSPFLGMAPGLKVKVSDQDVNKMFF